jgi:hypothetical protein
MLTKGLPSFTLSTFLPESSRTTLNIRRVKTSKVIHPQLQTSDSIINAGAPSRKGEVTFRDFSMNLGEDAIKKEVHVRPGTKPEIQQRHTPKTISAISLKSKDFRNSSKSFPSGGLAISEITNSGHKINDAIVSIEVPDGVEPDKLNEYELMFYGFQKRVAVNYINSILKNLGKFQKKYPNYKLPSQSRITMTARITYDKEGNVMQIRMVRWSKIIEIQNLFEDIVKGIDQLHNPPKSLWKSKNQFSMYYTLDILNG